MVIKDKFDGPIFGEGRGEGAYIPGGEGGLFSGGKILQFAIC